MTFLVELVNGAMTGLFQILLWPFRGLNPFWALLAVSLVSGLLMLWVFALTSNQEGIRRSKDRVRGNLLGVRLFQHDVGVVLKLQVAILKETLQYLRYSFAPVLFLLLPVLLILVQLNLFFSLRPLTPGEQSLLTVKVNGSPIMNSTVQLEESSGFIVETPPVRIPSRQEISWRIRAEEAGSHRIRLNVDGESFEKDLVVGDAWTAISPVRTDDWLEQLLYSGEQSLNSEGKVTSIQLAYSSLDFQMLGIPMDWLVVFFVLSIVAAFAFKGWFGVEI